MEIVKPHKKISKEVSRKDLQKVLIDSLSMIDYCSNPSENFKVILALAHCQIDEKDPLRFFVTREKEIIINPIIINHTNSIVDSVEGCVTFPEKSNIIVQRYNKCQVKYYIFDEEKVLMEIEEKLSGRRAKMFQHEIDHLNGIYIYE